MNFEWKQVSSVLQNSSEFSCLFQRQSQFSHQPWSKSTVHFLFFFLKLIYYYFSLFEFFLPIITDDFHWSSRNSKLRKLSRIILDIILISTVLTFEKFQFSWFPFPPVSFPDFSRLFRGLHRWLVLQSI